MNRSLEFVPVVALLLAAPIAAEPIVSANDGKQVLADGRQVVPHPRSADGVTIFDFAGGKLRTIGSVAVPTSVIGPPASIGLTPDGRYAIVTAARRVRPDGQDIEPDDQVSVISLAERRLVSTIHTGKGPSGVAIAPNGRRVLIANRADDSVSLYAFEGGSLTLLATQPFPKGASPAQPMFFDGGAKALVTRDGDHRIAVVSVEGTKVKLLEPVIAPGLRPYAIDAAPGSTMAVSGQIGGGGRDVDTLALIDLTAAAPVAVDSVPVGLTPEGVKVSHDGRFVAATVNNGSNLAHSAAGWSNHGLLMIWRIAGRRLVKVAEAPMGAWGQGLVWSRDGRWLTAQAMVGNKLQVFSFDGRRLRFVREMVLPSGPAAIAGLR